MCGCHSCILFGEISVRVFCFSNLIKSRVCFRVLFLSFENSFTSFRGSRYKSDMWFSYDFPNLWHVFRPFNGISCSAKVSNFDEVQLIFFGDSSTFCLALDLKGFLLFFFPRSLIVVHFTFRSVIHFELTLV